MKEKEKSCCFTGHRNFPLDVDADELIKGLDKAIWQLREKGYDTSVSYTHLDVYKRQE